MPFSKESVRKRLSRLSWAEGLTKEEIMLSLGEIGDNLDEELYYHLPANKKFNSAREVVDSLPNSVWIGIGNNLHATTKEVSGPKVAPDSAARGKTTLKAQKERTRERHLDEKGGD